MKDQILKLIDKLTEISKLPYSGALKYYSGLDIDQSGIWYKTEEYYAGSAGSTDIESFFVTWEEIDKPIEYFAEKFKTAHEKAESEKAKRKLEAEEKAKEEKRRLYEKLKKEFGD